METKTKRRNFAEAFKRDAVRLLLQGDKPLKQLAQDLGVSHWNLRDWKRRYGPPAPVRPRRVRPSRRKAPAAPAVPSPASPPPVPWCLRARIWWTG